jgi:hypothetical protein
MVEEAYCIAAVKETQAYKCRQRFRDGHAIGIGDDPRCGFPIAQCFVK